MADVSAPCTFHGRNSFDFENQKWQKTSINNNRQENLPGTQRSQRRNQIARKDRHRGPNHPAYLRLDSTGENSASSSEDLNGGFSPGIKFQASNHCSRPRLQEQEHQPFTETRQGGGLLNKVRSAFVASQRNTTRNLTQRTCANNPEARLASLDSVAEKFSNMNMTTTMNPQPWVNSMPNWQQQHHGSGFGGPAHQSAQGQWGQTANIPQDRNHIPIFHPYQGMAQPPLLSSTQNYQQNFYSPPWQCMMDRNHPSYPPFNHGFNPFAQPWHQQQRPHPPFPWQHWVGPQMMQGCHNQGSMTRQERARSPARKQRWNRHGYQQRTSPQSKAKPGGCHANKSKPVRESSIDRPSHIAEVKGDDILSMKEIVVDKRKDIGHVDGGSAIYSSVELGKTELIKKNIAIQNENIECQTSDKPEVCEMHDTKKPVSKAATFQRHSSIDLILSDYEVQSSIQDEVAALSATSDSEDSDGESDADSAVETNTDLWESFTSTDDPYNPLCGWRCNNDSIQKVVSPGVPPSSIRDCHVDSGTDEGDNWSETDSDDDYDSGDDIPDDDSDVDANLPRSLQLSAPQLQELRKNLSSTPNKKSTDRVSVHHPSVAFILGSPSSSSEDDDDWDTLDDTSALQDDPLWDSFNRVRDPYSPMEAWKCNTSNLSSNVPSPSQTTPMRKQDSVEGLRALLLSSTEQTIPQHCEEASPKDSDGESFAIATLRVYAARDDIDLGSPAISEAAMKRVASASCLRRVQVTPQNKASKKVRFCPNSSFIILVEKDPPQSCENNPSPAAKNDWLACARDRMRFKARIDQLSHILDPVLIDSHREQVYTTRMAMEGYR